MKKVTLIGASGFVGSAILNELLNSGHQVTAIVRHPERIKLSNEHLTVVGADATAPDQLARLAQGSDAVISAYNAGWGLADQYDQTVAGYRRLLEGVKASGVKRLLIVGGAGILYVKPGVRLADTGTLPAEWMPGVKAMYDVYLTLIAPETGLDWAYFAPAGQLEPGERTGHYRLGTDTLLTDDQGVSRISVQDYAYAMVRELEQPAHHRELFTIAY